MSGMDQFRNTYITECLELLEDMEHRLLALNPSQPDNEALHAIFRCAHSIKGGAGAFGLNAIARFTHVMESLLDELRENRISVTPAIVDALLKSADVSRAMVCMAQQSQEVPEGYGTEVEETLSTLLGASETAPSATPHTGCEATPPGVHQTWHIAFTPKPGLFLTGNDPLLIFRELSGLGECTVTTLTDALPPLARLDPEQCHLKWHITLVSDCEEPAIRSAFEFIDDMCDLTIEAQRVAPVTSQPADTETSPAQSAPGHGTPQSAQTAAGRSDQPASASIRVDLEKIDRLMNLVGEIVITQAMLESQIQRLPHDVATHVQSGTEALGHHTRELQEAVMAVRMQPVRSIFSRLPRLVRDLAGQLGKEIAIVLQGEQTEVDKTIIEQLSDPLTHLIRNAADHGVETPDVRTAKGKPREGTITVSAGHRGGRIVIMIEDDGAGINRARVLAKAQERGLVAPDAALSDEAIDQLIFLPGFSTAEQVSSVSGRGVGMDVVKRNIEAIGGDICIEARPEGGTRFVMSLPLTLAILDGMIVRAGTEHYIIPITSIMETLRPNPEQVHPLPDGTELMDMRGQYLPLVRLHRVFGIEGDEPPLGTALVVVVESGRDTLGLVVDELIGQQQVVIKSLEANSRNIPGISGATILGDGRVSLILEVSDLKRLTTPRQQPSTAQPVSLAA